MKPSAQQFSAFLQRSVGFLHPAECYWSKILTLLVIRKLFGTKKKKVIGSIVKHAVLSHGYIVFE